MKRIISFFSLVLTSFFLIGCGNTEPKIQKAITESTGGVSWVIAAKDLNESGNFQWQADSSIMLLPGQSATFSCQVPATGRYRIILSGESEAGRIWLEDYINNPDDRTYDITGKISLSGKFSVDGSPLQAGKHDMRIHADGDTVFFKNLTFDLIIPHIETPTTYKANISGNTWKLIWSDEFDTPGLPDASKWAYNIGNWGWGNNELQYYTADSAANARVENGSLIIQAHQHTADGTWTSARLTTQGKVAFLYGKIEFKAKVPTDRGVWSAGWLLGDDYRDEISWPYCGEIDILESVGYEIDDETGDGLNHASCHTPAYYFKKGNQITASIPVKNMHNDWHTYTIEWYPDAVHAFVDGEHYYTYDKTANELEWPFFKPQNIIVNLAIGGGWGGAKGLDPKMQSPKMEIDYIRVYELE
jgi:beta-glucanase (GH16 family)